MIVYVESNFVLEMALLQEEHKHCEAIMRLCGPSVNQLVIPVFSIAEPMETMTRRHRQREELNKTLTTEIRQLARTESYQEQAGAVQEITSLIVRSMAEEQSRLDDVLGRLLDCADTIPLNSAIFDSAAEYRVASGMSPQDSIVLASILHHLETVSPPSSCFLNKNSRDFADPDIVAALESRNCKVLFKFSTGLDYLRSQPQAAEAPDEVE